MSERKTAGEQLVAALRTQDIFVCVDCFSAFEGLDSEPNPRWSRGAFEHGLKMYALAGVSVYSGDADKRNEFSARRCKLCGSTLGGSREHLVGIDEHASADAIREEIARGAHHAHGRPVFSRGFDRYVCFGDTITCEFEGLTVTARIEHDADHGIDDSDAFSEDRHGGMYSEGARGDEEYANAIAARRAWERDEWHYCGVVLSVARDGVTLDEHAASLWGIECNFPRELAGRDNPNWYLTEVAHELLDEALEVGRAKLASLIDRDAPARDPEQDKLETLERMIDARSVAAVLAIVADVCQEKAQHIRENWQDEELAQAWERAARRVEVCAQSPAVLRVSP